MVETSRHEASFLRRELPEILAKEDKKLLAKIAFAVVFSKRRNFAADLEMITAPLGKPQVLGTENIPIQDSSPLIIVCNHPGVADATLGIAFISQVFSQERRKAGLSPDIRWFITANIPQGKSRLSLKDRGLLAFSNFFRQKFIRTYGFFPVPVSAVNDTFVARKRKEVFKRALSYLEEEATSTVGIAPEGGTVDREPEFQKGIGGLVRFSRRDDLKIMPVGIFRDELEKLTINFGPTMPALQFRHMKTEEATEKIKEAVLSLIAQTEEKPKAA